MWKDGVFLGSRGTHSMHERPFVRACQHIASGMRMSAWWWEGAQMTVSVYALIVVTVSVQRTPPLGGTNEVLTPAKRAGQPLAQKHQLPSCSACGPQQTLPTASVAHLPVGCRLDLKLWVVGCGLWVVG
jgi:hypothetical protein